ncbi:cupin domain-containing protein [Luteimonas viscosa]|uniref:Cupin domain-containing protein n=1 Tax=Luteimonas viscosa TaxID=1132694 RepID=A0A5D4XWI0_9GAMM|nr:cupin domain-containing protein [Luteimonas viscosa]TYT27240.1 cupin domain-containing protein [Luteimonas viscosa]
MDETERELIASHGLEPHPEGGHYRRMHVSAVEVEANGRRRPAMTAIRYLLGAGARSEWHRVDADEAWHWQQGGVLDLLQFDAARGLLSRTRLGPPPAGEALPCIVPAGTWQSAQARDAWVLVTCTVAPGFVWEGFELLDQGSGLAQELRRLGEVKR